MSHTLVDTFTQNNASHKNKRKQYIVAARISMLLQIYS